MRYLRGLAYAVMILFLLLLAYLAGQKDWE